MEKMKAWVLKLDQKDNIFHEVSMRKPSVERGKVLIKTMASSLNPIDYKIRMELKVMCPRSGIIHGDLSGEVVEVFDNSSKYKVGDRVFGMIGGVANADGALCEYALADERLLAKMPKKANELQSAVLPLVSITAYMALFDKLKLDQKNPKEPLLIVGGTGGVGHVAIQIAKSYGLTVHATTSRPDKIPILSKLGADEQVIYSDMKERFYDLTGGKGYKHIFDTVGGQTLPSTLPFLANEGEIASINTRDKIDLTALHSTGGTLHVVFMLLPIITGINRQRYGEILSDASRLFDEDKLRPMIDCKTFTFAEALDAHFHYEKREYLGKIGLKIR